MGMMLGEIWNLEALRPDCANDKVYEFLVVATALPISGALGTPVNRIAIKWNWWIDAGTVKVGLTIRICPDYRDKHVAGTYCLG